MKQRKGNKKSKSFEKRNKIKKFKTLKIFGANAAGIKIKLKSFDLVLKEVKPQIWMVQETKLKPNEKF